MYWRNMKLKIMIGLIVLAGILYIVVPIIIKVSTSNWNFCWFVFNINYYAHCLSGLACSSYISCKILRGTRSLHLSRWLTIHVTYYLCITIFLIHRWLIGTKFRVWQTTNRRLQLFGWINYSTWFCRLILGVFSCLIWKRFTSNRRLCDTLCLMRVLGNIWKGLQEWGRLKLLIASIFHLCSIGVCFT